MNGSSARFASTTTFFHNLYSITYQIALIAIGALFLALIVLLKSREDATLSLEPLLFIYTIFVTTFQLSRLIGAMFYEASFRGAFPGNSRFYPEVTAVAGSGADGEGFSPTVTFVIPCKNEEKDIAKTIANCFRAEYPKDKLEVIVINDGSTDNTAEVLYAIKRVFPNLTIIDWETNRGKKHAMAAGFKLAKGEILIQLDSDSYIDPKTFHQMILPFQNPQIGAVCAHADPENSKTNFLTKMQAAYYFMSFRIMKAAESTFLAVFCCSGCSSAYRKSAVMPILEDWLDEKFLGLPVTWGDDRALTSQVLKQGFKTIYTDKAKAVTIVPDQMKKLIKQQIRWKKSWFANAFLTSKFIFKTQPFVAITYFFPLILLSALSPLMAARALIYLPIVKGFFPIFYVSGIILFTALYAAYYRLVSPRNPYWPYLFVWSFFNLFVLTFLMFYALATIQDRGWGTR